MFKRAAVLMLNCGVLLSGCGPDSHARNAELLSNLTEAGFRPDDITVVDDAVYVGGDAHVPLAASREMLQRGEGSKEHFRTTNIVGSSVTRICVNPTAEFRSHVRLNQGLDMALANYNALGLRITFVRSPATGCSANITAKTMAGDGHAAGFPSGGLPYGTISIGTGLNSYGVDVSEHVITHALGHTIGLRHTDLFNPSISCGSGGGGGVIEPTGTGALHIPGTPTGATPGGSIMNACYPPDTDGEFTPSDIVALNYMY
ncbi:M57 family metalloprotease [Myxococcus sp. NMCA1]|uniref:M57 family metalloprotease n=1 Tax=Myxococcus sp. NMCA1 TaxID=2996785 RepID=UPI002285CDC8|nr:M57 family metalloprotease [Myxococcus sp. NMCA1]WAM28661.1 M57 family metalloprotease [Myxococcus sp. NMCA1]